MSYVSRTPASANSLHDLPWWLSILLRLADFLLRGFAVMIFLGAAHAQDPRVPALGFYTATLLVLAVDWAVHSNLFKRG